MADNCTPINVDVADWLLTQTPLSRLPPDGQQLLKDSFPVGAAGAVSGKLCLIASSESSPCKKSEKAEQGKCCKFTATPHLVVMNIPDKIKFSVAAAGLVSPIQAEQLADKIKSLRLTEPAPSAKPFGGFRIDGIALVNYQYVWIKDKTVYATGFDGSEWFGADTQGLDDDKIGARTSRRAIPAYQDS